MAWPSGSHLAVPYGNYTSALHDEAERLCTPPAPPPLYARTDGPAPLIDGSLESASVFSGNVFTVDNIPITGDPLFSDWSSACQEASPGQSGEFPGSGNLDYGGNTSVNWPGRCALATWYATQLAHDTCSIVFGLLQIFQGIHWQIHLRRS
jgi:hypothetical protein